MTARGRWFVGAVLGAAALAAGVYLAPADRTGGEAGPGPGAAPAGRPGLGVEELRQEQLEVRRQDLLARMASLDRVAQEVIAGRLSLVEAAARFRAIDAASTTFHWEAFRRTLSGGTDEEKQCRAVIDRVSCQLANDPERARAVTRRLEAKLQAYLEGHRPRELGAAGQSGGSPRATRAAGWSRRRQGALNGRAAFRSSLTPGRDGRRAGS